MTRNTFGKHERLTNRRLIDRLFNGGRVYKSYPLMLLVLPTETEEASSPVQLLVSVSKRNFKRAPDRNRLKRLIREGWRCHKHDLYERLSAADMNVVATYVFIGRDLHVDAAEVAAKISALNQRLIEDIPNLTGGTTANETVT